MSRFLIVLLSTFFSFSTLAQDVSKSDQGKIEQRLQEYTDITNENNWDELMEYIYPGLFDIASKQDMVKIFASLEEMGMTMSMDEMKIKEFVGLGTIGDEKFVAVPYSAYVYMTFSGDAIAMMPMMKTQFDSQFGEGNVFLEQDKNRYKLFQEKVMLGVYMKDLKEWYFIDVDQSQQEMFATILPKEILDKVKAL